MARPSLKRVRLCMTLPPEMLARIKAEAAAAHTTASFVIEQALARDHAARSQPLTRFVHPGGTAKC